MKSPQHGRSLQNLDKIKEYTMEELYRLLDVYLPLLLAEVSVKCNVSFFYARPCKHAADRAWR